MNVNILSNEELISYIEAGVIENAPAKLVLDLLEQISKLEDEVRGLENLLEDSDKYCAECQESF